MSNYDYDTVLNNIKSQFYFECKELIIYYSRMSFKVKNYIVNIIVDSRNKYELRICDSEFNIIFVFEFKTQKSIIDYLNNLTDVKEN